MARPRQPVELVIAKGKKKLDKGRNRGASQFGN